MSFKSALVTFFKKLGALIKKGVLVAAEHGLTDDILKTALEWVRVAATQFTDNPTRREFVVKVLVTKGVPESLARLAVELAVQLFKKELDKLPAAPVA